MRFVISYLSFLIFHSVLVATDNKTWVRPLCFPRFQNGIFNLDKLSSCLWYFVCCLVAVSNTVAAEQKPWNIVYIMADDMGYGDVGCFDATKIKTPAIDSIARGGMAMHGVLHPTRLRSFAHGVFDRLLSHASETVPT